jgi:hypothetical protein
MSKRILFSISFAILLIASGSREARAQSRPLSKSETPKFETSVVFSYLNLRELREGPGGVGGRVTFNVNDKISLEGEASYFPENPSGNFGETTGFFGVKAGKRVEKIGMFGKLRPGFINFGGRFFDLRLSKREFFALDVGGVVEFYPSPYVVLRLDFRDVVIPYGDAKYLLTLVPKRLGTSHNLQQSFSIGMRF